MKAAIEALFDKYLTGDLSRAEAATLKEVLAADPDVAEQFSAYLLETALLLKACSQSEIKDVFLSPGMVSRRPWRRRLLLAAACLTLVGGLWYSRRRWRVPASRPRAAFV